MIIPALLLVLFSAVDIADTGAGASVDFLAPGVLALAVMSTAFTGQAIATGFERRYGVLKRLGASPLPRWALMTAKTLSVLVTEVLQIVLLTVIAFALGWSPHGNPLAVLLLLVLGTAAFSGLGLLMAGTLKAEATLAAANLVFLLLLVGGGVIVPLDKFPDAVRSALELLPVSRALRGSGGCLQHGAPMPWGHAAILVVWAVLGLGAAARFFRWE
ncbi:ABC transporter permease [Streptomyces californicus]